ncbi:hypothetical protein GIB67_003404 [Kingdonia uniflora]|uniref:Uncharacterized protein n=1 Tax=Kingdonia uniflora TaxID=39325 RepID=A0A7J7P922_9MAGN|nr:hypothetical protein GIB67_003404 [Kingdonia uniflora]
MLPSNERFFYGTLPSILVSEEDVILYRTCVSFLFFRPSSFSIELMNLSQWDYLKRQWQVWRGLINWTGHGNDPILGTFDWPEDVWENIIAVNSEAKKYKTAHLQHRDLMKKLFDGLSATGDFVWSLVMVSVPSTQQIEYVPLPDDMNVDDTEVPNAGVDYTWEGDVNPSYDVIPSYDVTISSIREPTPGSTSRSRTPVSQDTIGYDIIDNIGAVRAAEKVLLKPLGISQELEECIQNVWMVHGGDYWTIPCQILEHEYNGPLHVWNVNAHHDDDKEKPMKGPEEEHIEDFDEEIPKLIDIYELVGMGTPDHDYE